MGIPGKSREKRGLTIFPKNGITPPFSPIFIIPIQRESTPVRPNDNSKAVFAESNEDDIICDNTSKLIVIRSDNYNEVGNFVELQKKQLRHEIIHAFLSESGLQSNFEHCQEFGHEETMVDWIAVQFPKILKVYQELDIL